MSFGTWAQALTGILMLALVPVRATVSGSYFQHFTDWGWSLVALFVLAELVPRWRRPLTVLGQPLVFAVSTYIVAAADVMMGYEYRVVADAYRDYSRATVEFVNFLLHTLPWCIFVTVVMLRWPERGRVVWRSEVRSVAKNVPRATQYGQAVLGLSYLFAVSYLYTFSPDAEYGLRRIDNRNARVYSAAIQPLLAGLYAAGVVYTCWRQPGKIK